jgi:hypothetical protein
VDVDAPAAAPVAKPAQATTREEKRLRVLDGAVLAIVALVLALGVRWIRGKKAKVVAALPAP